MLSGVELDDLNKVYLRIIRFCVSGLILAHSSTVFSETPASAVSPASLTKRPPPTDPRPPPLPRALPGARGPRPGAQGPGPRAQDEGCVVLAILVFASVEPSSHPECLLSEFLLRCVFVPVDTRALMQLAMQCNMYIYTYSS